MSAVLPVATVVLKLAFILFCGLGLRELKDGCDTEPKTLSDEGLALRRVGVWAYYVSFMTFVLSMKKFASATNGTSRTSVWVFWVTCVILDAVGAIPRALPYHFCASPENHRAKVFLEEIIHTELATLLTSIVIFRARFSHGLHIDVFGWMLVGLTIELGAEWHEMGHIGGASASIFLYFAIKIALLTFDLAIDNDYKSVWFDGTRTMALFWTYMAGIMLLVAHYSYKDPPDCLYIVGSLLQYACLCGLIYVQRTTSSAGNGYDAV